MFCSMPGQLMPGQLMPGQLMPGQLLLSALLSALLSTLLSALPAALPFALLRTRCLILQQIAQIAQIPQAVRQRSGLCRRRCCYCV